MGLKHGQSIRYVDAEIIGSYCEQGTKSFGMQFGHLGAFNNVICANFGLKTRSVYFRTGGNACHSQVSGASPPGCAPVSMAVGQPSHRHRSPGFARVFWAHAHSGDLAPATFA
jgi:hypothetical protein